MKPTDIACRACAAQPGSDCERWSDLLGGMTTVAGFVHPERIEDSAWEMDMNEPVAPVSGQAVENALNKSGFF